MDSITQALLGASVQGAMLGRWQGRKALAYGAVLGTLPDLDVVIDYGDAVANMTYHRGFSHSLFVLSIVAVLLTWLIRRFRPDERYSGTRLFLTVWLVLVTHVLLDAFTSYGTQLLWPLTTPPIAWSSIFIIDPLYSVPLLIAVLAGITRQGIEVERMFSTPTPFNSLLWRVILVDGEHYYETLVSWWDDAPPVLVRLPRNAHLADALDGSPQHERLRWFSGDVLRYDVDGDQLLVTDLRLGMTGFHPFRFPLAERSAEGWQLVERPERLPANRGNMRRLESIWQRIWKQEPALPLAAWAAELNGKTIR